MTETPTYKFEVFEGPLDLLLSLIEKHKIDIYDIQISLLLEQYMLYIKEAKERNWDLTADFIEMAARLLGIGPDLIDGQILHAAGQKFAFWVVFHGHLLLFLPIVPCAVRKDGRKPSGKHKKCVPLPHFVLYWRKKRR